jgi:competence protein ComEC
VEQHLIDLDHGRGELAATVLKAGHHGSKNSTSDAWLAAVHPETVAISAGANNSYGHPNPETIERIKKEGAKIVSTINEGTIRLVSNGRAILQK